MITFKVNTDFSAVKRTLTDIQKKYVPAAAGTALNRVGTTVRAASSKRIRDKLALNAAVVRGALSIKRAGSQRLAVAIEASGKPIPLRDFQARMTRRGATFRVSKSGGRKRYQRQGRTGFILERMAGPVQPGKSGSLDRVGGHVLVRVEDEPKGPRRPRIKKAFGPSIPQYFVTKIVMKLMEDTARERWPIEFNNALRGILIRRTGTDIKR